MAIDYQALIDDAMLGIVRKALLQAQEDGLSDDQSFYISFQTDHPEVVLSKYVKSQYPKEITIVLQYQYKDLRVLSDRFLVNISFGGVSQTIQVPFSAITSFSDPSVNFSLQLKVENNVKAYDLMNQDKETGAHLIDIDKKNDKPQAGSSVNEKRESGEIISFEKFRNKPK
jgi:uncharacterized protein